jgi:hypothetical protein
LSGTGRVPLTLSPTLKGTGTGTGTPTGMGTGMGKRFPIGFLEGEDPSFPPLTLRLSSPLPLPLLLFLPAGLVAFDASPPPVREGEDVPAVAEVDPVRDPEDVQLLEVAAPTADLLLLLLTFALKFALRFRLLALLLLRLCKNDDEKSGADALLRSLRPTPTPTPCIRP